MQKIDCEKCIHKVVCKQKGDPWNLKRGGKESGWCPICSEAVDGKESGREIPISFLGLSPDEEANLLSKKMKWEHPIATAPWKTAKKIRELLTLDYTIDEIETTLGARGVDGEPGVTRDQIYQERKKRNKFLKSESPKKSIIK